MNTVHVRDVVRALWHLRDAGPSCEVYNLVDKGETSEFDEKKWNYLLIVIFGLSSRCHLRASLPVVSH